MFRYVKGFASNVMEKERFSIPKNRQKYSKAHRETLKFSRKKIKFLSLPLNQMETFIKVLSAQMWLSSLALYCWDFQIPQNLNKITCFHSEITWPFLTAPTHNILLGKEPLLFCRTDENNSKTKTNHPPLKYQEVSPLPF